MPKANQTLMKSTDSDPTPNVAVSCRIAVLDGDMPRFILREGPPAIDKLIDYHSINGPHASEIKYNFPIRLTGLFLWPSACDCNRTNAQNMCPSYYCSPSSSL